jgi:hypothetical protein
MINSGGKELLMNCGLYLNGMSMEEYANDKMITDKIRTILNRLFQFSTRLHKNIAIGAASMERV